MFNETRSPVVVHSAPILLPFALAQVLWENKKEILTFAGKASFYILAAPFVLAVCAGMAAYETFEFVYVPFAR